MDLMISIYDAYLCPKQEHNVNRNNDELLSYQKQVEPIMELVRSQRVKLAHEVDRWCKERNV